MFLFTCSNCGKGLKPEDVGNFGRLYISVPYSGYDELHYTLCKKCSHENLNPEDFLKDSIKLSIELDEEKHKRMQIYINNTNKHDKCKLYNFLCRIFKSFRRR